MTGPHNRHYIAGARQKRPTVPPEVSNYIVESYVRLRKLSKEDEEQKKSHSYTSARTLLGVLRLSQALARLRYEDEVEHVDVDEALRLMEVSKASLYDDDEKERDFDRSDVSQIYRLIKDMADDRRGGPKRKPKRARRLGRSYEGQRDRDSDEEEGEEELPLVDIRARVLANGFTEAQLMETIIEVCLPLYTY